MVFTKGAKVLVLLATTASATFTPTTDENMNGEYIISKTPNAPGNFSTNYKDYPGRSESIPQHCKPHAPSLWLIAMTIAIRLEGDIDVLLAPISTFRMPSDAA